MEQDWQLYEGRWEVGIDWKKVKGLVKEHTWRTNGHGQYEWADYGIIRGAGWVEGGQGGKSGTTVIA